MHHLIIASSASSATSWVRLVIGSPPAVAPPLVAPSHVLPILVSARPPLEAARVSQPLLSKLPLPEGRVPSVVDCVGLAGEDAEDVWEDAAAGWEAAVVVVRGSGVGVSAS